MTQEMNCSDGAKMLIERMQTNPHEFWGGGSKWNTVMHQAFSRVRGSSETHMMLTERDAIALHEAFDKYVREPMLAEHVIKNIMAPQLERKQVTVTPRPPGKSITAVDYEKFLRDKDMWNSDVWYADPFNYPHGPLK
jgi:hypothetical protein